MIFTQKCALYIYIMLHQHTYVDNCFVYHAARKKWLLKTSYNIEMKDHTTISFNIWSLKRRVNVRKKKKMIQLISFAKLHIHVKTSFLINIIIFSFIYIYIYKNNLQWFLKMKKSSKPSWVYIYTMILLMVNFMLVWFYFFSYTTKIMNKNRHK